MPALLLLICFCFLSLFYGSAESAQIRDIELSGIYHASLYRFEGSIRYKFTKTPVNRFLFHLPPNWYSESDNREEFQLNLKDNTFKNVDRSKLKELKKYRRRNRHLPKKIDVLSVKINGKRISYQILDNKNIRPNRNARGSLLSFFLNIPSSSNRVTTVDIDFVTHFNPLPDGFRRILYDFAPRIVLQSNMETDLADKTKSYHQYNMDVLIKQPDAGAPTRRINRKELTSNPFILADVWDIEHRLYRLSMSKYLATDIDFFQTRIHRVLNFLIKDKWILTSSLPYHFIFWDGPITVCGNNILFPRRLFRYAKIFHKVFEVAIINGIVSAIIHQRYQLNPINNPWILPALEAEIIRHYFERVYDGNQRLFPWLNWFNPDFFGDYTALGWIINLPVKTAVGANDSLDWIYFSHVFHPWHVKGFHLLRVLYSGNGAFEDAVLPKVRRLLRNESAERPLLESIYFWNWFAENETSEKRGKTWLSDEGTVDFSIDAVEIMDESNGKNVQLEISNSGSVSPVVEVIFIGSEGKIFKTLIKNGAGVYTFKVEFEPQQVVLDPNQHLLEDVRLNNSWNLPIRIRPFWDFSSADRWLFTVSPLITGNTLDENLLGLNFNLSYFDITGFDVNIWKRGKDNQTLWEGALFHIGYPFKGTKTYYEFSELGASKSQTIGITQSFGHINPDYWADVNLWENEFDIFGSDIDDELSSRWIGGQISCGFPIIEGNFTQWDMTLQASAGKSVAYSEQTFEQQFFEQEFIWQHWGMKFLISQSGGYSFGMVPNQKLYPVGGPEALPGFPRETDLLFFERQIFKTGFTLIPILTHTDIHLMRLLWLDRIEPTVNFRWAEGRSKNEMEAETFQDVELKLDFFGEFINRYDGSATISLAKPINHAAYEDYRIILFSSWVF